MKEKFKKIYKEYFGSLWLTLKFSGVIILILLLIYLIFALILNMVGSFSNLNFLSYLLLLLLLSLIMGFIEPFFYAFLTCCSALHSKSKEEVNLSLFFKAYLAGRRPPFKGILRIWNIFLFSIIIYLLISSVASGILFAYSLNPGTEMNLIYNEILAITSTDTLVYLDELNTILANHAEYIRFVNLFSNFPALILSLYYFLHTICVGTIKYYYVPALLNVPSPVIHFIHKRVIKEHRKEYYSGYYAIIFPLIIIFVAAFSLSYFLIGMLGSQNLSIDILSLTAIVITLIVLTPFFPIIILYQGSIIEKFVKYAFKCFVQSAEQELNIYKTKMSQLNQNQEVNIDRVTQNIEMIKDKIEEIDKRDKDNEEKDEENKNGWSHPFLFKKQTYFKKIAL